MPTETMSPETRQTQTPQLPPGPKVNLGCGPIQPDGWVNVDCSNRAWFAKKFWPLDRMLTKLRLLSPTEFGRQVVIHNLFKPLPFADASVACVYAGEVWEHFEYADAARLTAECFRVLAPGGVLRLRVPDGAAYWRRYIELYDEMMQKPKADRSAASVRKHLQWFFNDICTRKSLLKSMGHYHKWQFDELQLVELLETAGFTNVERRPFHQSRIADVQLVETCTFLIVEGVKPPAAAGV